ncbi:MAG TPA: glycoside hydrolase family 75 protein [Bryobacteraceae bacterium]|nr:glycoside hydrolase family 75 protein [Bryobacteraceae bacterium]
MGKPYEPPGDSADLLGSIPNLIAHPKTRTVTSFFIGKTFLCELPGGQLYFESALEVDTDGSIYSAQDPTGAKPDRAGVSPTSTRDAAGRSLDSDKINYFVLPKGGFDTRYKIGLGDIAVVIYKSRIAYACYGDRGPPNKLGEGSISLHRALGNETVAGGRLINAAKGGNGIDSGVITIIFPGTGNGSGRINSESAAIGKEALLKLKTEAFQYDMERLSRYRTRQISIPSDRDALVAILSDWMQEVLDHTPRQPDTDGDGEDLVNRAGGVDTLLYAPFPASAGMAIPARGTPTRTKSTVYADFALGHTPSGTWFVRQVRFHLDPADQAQALKAQADDARNSLRANLLEKAGAKR